MTIVRASASAIARFLRRFGGRAQREAEPGGGPRDGLACQQRELVTRRIMSTIHNNSILLCGPPGGGKSAILRDLKDRLSEGGGTSAFFPVYVNLRDITEDVLFSTVSRAVFDQLQPENLKGPECTHTGYGHRDLAHDLRRIIRALKKREGGHPRLVLLVDGIDELNHYEPRTTQRLRSLFMMSLDGSLVMVATAVEIDRHWAEEGSPWYNFFEEFQLAPSAKDPRCDTSPG